MTNGAGALGMYCTRGRDKKPIAGLARTAFPTDDVFLDSFVYFFFRSLTKVWLPNILTRRKRAATTDLDGSVERAELCPDY